MDGSEGTRPGSPDPPEDRGDADSSATRIAQSEARLRNLTTAMPMGIHEYELRQNGDLVFVGANPAADRLLGVDHAQFVGRTLEDAFPPLADTEIPQRYRDAARHGSSWSSEQIDYADDRIRGAFEVHAFQTSPGHMAALFLDIGERKRTEDALTREEQRYRLLTESSLDIVWTIGLDDRLTYVSPAVEELLGWTVEEFLDLSSDKYLTPESTERLTGVLTGELAKPPDERLPHTTLEAVHRTKDGGELATEVRASWLLDAEGEVVGVQGTTRDISGRLRAETERRALQEQLQQSQKLEVAGQLAGGVAHDFNNLLTAIAGCAELMAMKLPADNPVGEEVRDIVLAAERGAELVQHLLAFSRRQVVSPRVIQPNETLRDSQRMLGRVIGEDIALRFQAQPDLWTVRLDPTQLDQILVNLVANARDAMPDGGELAIITRNLRLDDSSSGAPPGREGDYVLLAVEDNGIGMDAEAQARIFEPFFTTKSPGAGSGLGLSTVYGIVEQAGGFVAVESEPNVGTAVQVHLPRTTAEPEVVEDIAPAATAGGSETLLLVEDDALVRRLMQRALVQLGYQILVAADGMAGLQLIEQHVGAIDLVITDLVMPRLGGRLLVEQLHDRHPEVKVVIMSGHAADDVRAILARAPGAVFLPKPVSIALLCQTIRKLLDG